MQGRCDFRPGFIGVAQSAGFKLREIKELIDGADGLGEPMRSLSSQKLGEVEALLERTKAKSPAALALGGPQSSIRVCATPLGTITRAPADSCNSRSPS